MGGVVSGIVGELVDQMMDNQLADLEWKTGPGGFRLIFEVIRGQYGLSGLKIDALGSLIAR